MDNHANGGVWYRLFGDVKVHTVDRLATTNIHPNRKLPFWVFGVVYSGNRTISVGNENGNVQPRGYFLLPANVLHRGIDADTHDVIFVHFDIEGEEVDINAPSTSLDDQIILPVFGELPMPVDLLPQINYICRQYQMNLLGDNFMDTQMKSILFHISLFMTTKWKMMRNPHDSITYEIATFIRKNLDQKLNASDFERYFHISYRQLNIIFNKQFGTTIRQKIIESRIENAFNLLVNGVTISAAATLSGFNDYFYFLKCFKKVKGMSPKQMMNRYRLNDALGE